LQLKFAAALTTCMGRAGLEPGSTDYESSRNPSIEPNLAR